MKIFQPLCVAVLVLSAYAGNVAASAPAVSDDSLAFSNMTDNPAWETPDLPYARLLASSSALNAAPHWSSLVNGHYIELVDGTGRSYTDLIDGELRTDPNDPSVCYHTPGAYDGSQFAELNCEAYGALYQDVLTVPGSTLNWSLAHKGRKPLCEECISPICQNEGTAEI